MGLSNKREGEGEGEAEAVKESRCCHIYMPFHSL